MFLNDILFAMAPLSLTINTNTPTACQLENLVEFTNTLVSTHLKAAYGEFSPDRLACHGSSSTFLQFPHT